MADDTHGVPGTSQFQFNFVLQWSLLGLSSAEPFSKSSSTVSPNTAVDLTHEQEVRSYFLFKAQNQMKLFLLLGVQQRVQLQSSYHKP